MRNNASKYDRNRHTIKQPRPLCYVCHQPYSRHHMCAAHVAEALRQATGRHVVSVTIDTDTGTHQAGHQRRFM